MSEQTKTAVCLAKAFRGMDEVHGETKELRGREALEAAKRNQRAPVPIKRSEITISEGEGRATRECEMIWWPLYSQSDSGKLTIRIYIGKVDI